MIRIGITGQSGFIGSHLYNSVGLFPEKFKRVEFKDDYFSQRKMLEDFVHSCDVIIHLAGMNRHNDPNTIYKTNIDLVNWLIEACLKTNSKPHIIFSSSVQEDYDNMYGRSKKVGRELFEKWAENNNAIFTGLIIQNVFGAFGNPYYNSVVATFCHQLTHKEIPKIEIDSLLKLIHVSELVKNIIEIIETISSGNSEKPLIQQIKLPHNTEITVSELLSILRNYKLQYFEKGEIPELHNTFQINLFNTFLTYIDHSSFFPFYLKSNCDDRGSFVEILKFNSRGQVSFSTTLPGITRGNHYHTHKAERFAVIKGNALIKIRRIGTSKILSFVLDGNNPSFVDMPIWYTHNITNIGEGELFTVFWSNDHFNPKDSDTYYEGVEI